MKHASGLNTCTKIYIFIYLQPAVNKNSQNLAIFTLQFDDLTVKTIIIRVCDGNPNFH